MSIPRTEWVQKEDGWSLKDSTGHIKQPLGFVEFSSTTGSYHAFGHDGADLGSHESLHKAQEEVEGYLNEFMDKIHWQ